MKKENIKTSETTCRITRFAEGHAENELPEAVYTKLKIIGALLLKCNNIYLADGRADEHAKWLVGIFQKAKASGIDGNSFVDRISGRVLSIIFDTIRDNVNSYTLDNGKNAIGKLSLDAIQSAIQNDENLAGEIQKTPFFENTSNVSVLTEIMNGTSTFCNCEYDLNILERIDFDKRFRNAIDLMRNLSDPKREPQATIQDAVQILDDLQSGFINTSTSTLDSGREAAVADLSTLIQSGPEALGNVMSGLKPLDDHLGGFRMGEYAVIAARPSVGKTALAMQIIKNAASQGKKVYLSSLEMTKESLCQRCLLADANIDISLLNSGLLVPAQKEDFQKKLEVANANFQQFSQNIIIQESETTDIDEICANVRWAHLRDKISMFVIDYLQLASSRTHSQARHLEVAYISQRLKHLAKTLKIPVIALCQLNRESEDSRNDDSEPKLSQIRESGAIEQDADVVLLLHRSKKITEELRNKPYPVAINIAKVRNGGGGKISLTFTPQTTTFSEPTATSPTQSKPEGSGRFTPPAGLFS